jgi:hypothetical protein
MSRREVLNTVNALLRDDALGLRAMTEAVAGHADAPLGQPGPFSSDFNFVPWSNDRVIQPTSRGNVMVKPGRFAAKSKYTTAPDREARVQIFIGYECYGASIEDVHNQQELVIGATLLVLDQLRYYSDANRGTIADFEGDIVFDPDDDGATWGGFVCDFTVNERSLND